MLSVLIAYMSDGTYSLNSTRNDGFFFGKRFISKFIYFQSATVAQALKEETIFSLKNIGSAKYLFFLQNALKKLLNIFLNFFFYLKVQSFRLIMENNFIQMAALGGHAVAYAIAPIFKHIIDCVQLYFTKGFTNIVL